jgi:hypothetical protein
VSAGESRLEQELRVLATGLWPDTPELTAAVRARIEAPAPAPRRRRWRPVGAIALAVLVAATAAVLAVPQARTALLRALGIGSVRIELVDDLPAVAPRSDLSLLGNPVTRDEAAAGFRGDMLDVPGSLGDPDEIRLAHDDAAVTYVWRDGGEIRLLVSQLPGRLEGESYVKAIRPDSVVDSLTVDGRHAVWLEGVHGFGLVRPDGEVAFEELRLAGNALIVADGDRTLRIEGDLDRARAVAIARALV